MTPKPKEKPTWWRHRYKFENCDSGFCRHCGWINVPRKIYRYAKKKKT